MGVQEAIWLRKFLVELFGQSMDPTIIHCDNQSYINLLVNPVFHDRSKPIEIPCHYVRDMTERNVVQLRYIITGEQTADILTKPLSKTKVEYFRGKLVLEDKLIIYYPVLSAWTKLLTRKSLELHRPFLHPSTFTISPNNHKC